MRHAGLVRCLCWAYGAAICAYPREFRRRFGREMLQVFRCRAQSVADAQGVSGIVWFTLQSAADWMITFPREAVAALHAASGAAPQPAGLPFFYSCDRSLPPAAALANGALLAAAFLAGVCAVIAHGGGFPSLLADNREPHIPRPASSIPAALVQAACQDGKLDSAERERVIDAVIANLKQYYVDPAVGRKVTEALAARRQSGAYDAVTDSAAFAALLTRQLREWSGDRHLDVVYSVNPLPDRPPTPSPEAQARYRAAMEQQNCTIQQAEVVRNTIGYLKLNSFPDPSVCREKVVAALARLNGSGAIIFDLRDNTGGYPEMVSLVAAYLFDHPEYLYNPRENTSLQSWTESPVPGNRLADKPVYLLTSSRTLSGAEQFSYDLKMLRRATLVGETTGGAAHSGRFHRIDEHFGMGIPETRPLNPFSKADWDGTGVEPDVKLSAADALDAAEKLAAKRVGEK